MRNNIAPPTEEKRSFVARRVYGGVNECRFRLDALPSRTAKGEATLREKTHMLFQITGLEIEVTRRGLFMRFGRTGRWMETYVDFTGAGWHSLCWRGRTVRGA